MNIAKRFAFYGFGFVIGLILLFFFLSGKKTSCDYGPTARTLKNIRIKKRVISENALLQLENYQLDTAAISKILKKGDVLFSESDTDNKNCKVYTIVGEVSETEYKVKIENCAELATVLSFEPEA
ncbi:hypothetical protein [Patiriisocius sp. Uisw_017]|jgi:hypothetical protein|uniref:hypothetical protein n=1 Tax=Patiriisocius sp. Uisw_017 TaxID=3230968 RepID=UPI0039E8E5F9